MLHYELLNAMCNCFLVKLSLIKKLLMISESSHHHVIAFTYSKYCLESENMLLYEFEASK